MRSSPPAPVGDAAIAASGPEWLAKFGHAGHFWIVPEFKLLYVSTAKNACTTLKWVVAQLAGEDLGSFKAALKPYINDDHAVHNRALYKKIRYPDQLDPAITRQIHPDNGWLVIAVVRDPRSRMFSAWEDKFLFQDSAYRRWRTAPWYPDIPHDAADVVGSWAHFVDVFNGDPHFPLRQDTHFRQQVATLRPDLVPYSRIYPIEAMRELQADLVRHVESLGWTGALDFRHSNDTPLRANPQAYPDGIRQAVEAIYAPDFQQFGELWSFDKIATTPEWTPDDLREAEVRAELGRRLSEMRKFAMDFRAKAEKSTRTATELAERRSKLRQDLSQARREVANLEAGRANGLGRRAWTRGRRLAGRVVARLRQRH